MRVAMSFRIFAFAHGLPAPLASLGDTFKYAGLLGNDGVWGKVNVGHAQIVGRAIGANAGGEMARCAAW